MLAVTIHGWKLKVPNWITLPMIIAGWAYAGAGWNWGGLGASLAGTVLGLGLLLPAYAIGGMGAGDVKLLAGAGAWIGVNDTLWAFAVSALIGGLIAVGMVVWRKKWKHHQQQFVAIVDEILLVRDPAQLSDMAAQRKSRMMLSALRHPHRHRHHRLLHLGQNAGLQPAGSGRTPGLLIHCRVGIAHHNSLQSVGDAHPTFASSGPECWSEPAGPGCMHC